MAEKEITKNFAANFFSIVDRPFKVFTKGTPQVTLALASDRKDEERISTEDLRTLRPAL